MLHELHIESLGVIDRLDLVLGRGLTALTGETGAGKTMLVEAISLLVGGRADATMVRPGATDIPPASESGWTWPALGLLTSPFGPAHPLGIDVAAPVGTPIYAANSGQVTFVGGNPCCSYGYHVIIDHGNGYETLYAHMSTFAVESGAWVNAGDVIGYIGLTGRTTGPHVHFELRRNGVYQDPLNYLP